MKKKMYIIVVLCSGIMVLGMLASKVSGNYVENASVRKNINNIIKLCEAQASGIINYEDTNGTLWHITVFDQVNMYSWTNKSGGEVCPYIQVKSSNIIFGDGKVSIGMNKEKVLNIFKNSKRTSSYLSDTVYILDENGNITQQIVDAYYDDSYDYSLGFVYDENDIVKYIYVGLGL